MSVKIVYLKDKTYKLDASYYTSYQIDFTI
jgi:hypothetical protein